MTWTRSSPQYASVLTVGGVNMVKLCFAIRVKHFTLRLEVSSLAAVAIFPVTSGSVLADLK